MSPFESGESINKVGLANLLTAKQNHKKATALGMTTSWHIEYAVEDNRMPWTWKMRMSLLKDMDIMT